MRLPPVLQKWKLEDVLGRTNALWAEGVTNPLVVGNAEVVGNEESDGNMDTLRGKGMANELVGKRTARLWNCENVRDEAKGELLNCGLTKGTRCMNGEVVKRGVPFIIIGLVNPPRIMCWASTAPADTASADTVIRDSNANLMMNLPRCGRGGWAKGR